MRQQHLKANSQSRLTSGSSPSKKNIISRQIIHNDFLEPRDHDSTALTKNGITTYPAAVLRSNTDKPSKEKARQHGKWLQTQRAHSLNSPVRSIKSVATAAPFQDLWLSKEKSLSKKSRILLRAAGATDLKGKRQYSTISRKFLAQWQQDTHSRNRLAQKIVCPVFWTDEVGMWSAQGGESVHPLRGATLFSRTLAIVISTANKTYCFL
nr:uncharacterized protein LOC110075620 isoform X2 [Pogona vitticeps]